MEIRKGSVIEGQKLEGEANFQNSWSLHKITFRNCIFNNCNFKRAMIRKCVFENCEFTDCSFYEAELVTCSFSSCRLLRCDFTYAFTSKNIGGDSGEFIDVDFIKCNFSGAYFFFPLVTNTKFENCKLNRVQFDGSRLKDVVFIGKIDGAWFKGYSMLAYKSFLGIFHRMDPKKYPNKMENVDFTKCELVDVMFSQGIDLSKCRFDPKANGLYVENLKQFFEQVLMLIDEELPGEVIEPAKILVHKVYFNEDKQEQPNDYIDLNLSSYHELAYNQNQLFNLFRKVHSLQSGSK